MRFLQRARLLLFLYVWVGEWVAADWVFSAHFAKAEFAKAAIVRGGSGFSNDRVFHLFQCDHFVQPVDCRFEVEKKTSRHDFFWPVLSPVYNFSTTQSSVLIALPTVTATLVRIPLSVSTIRFGTIAPIILSQSVAMFGLFALVIVIFFAPVGPEMFGVFCFLALVIGVAGKDWLFVFVVSLCNRCIGSVFPLCFLQVSFWTPKAHQGLACAAFIGIGAMGTSVFTLVISVCFCSWFLLC